MSTQQSTVRHRMMHTGNRLGVSLYRHSGGRIGGHGTGGVRVILVTVPGRRTGLPRTTPVGAFPYQGGLLVVGSGSASPQEPDWFRNLRKAARAEVQVGKETYAAGIRVLTGAERDSAFHDVVVAQVPRYGTYEAKCGRPMPLAVLTRLPS
ncbi:deazaflavin-dependent oxidoreductase, nitroreductase family [Pedococcus cremeus]|uniref:Deazaflavin-dependent oxidoreductase, nitroreductase family n=1 Tax=Pedococcus cremeus TaxID=587636 RepID=A0A1H9VSM7_9MICO|nr:nitroreductase family deazaflavin-dependent oxidoreductase [Pedococcus cremeus]SES24538.1 deazaflavin-dependent oxidoreductase, nitroreductase family [Pedococcus cremeus]